MSTNNSSNVGTVLPVSRGGTGVASLAANAVVCGGTTSTGPLQTVSGTGTTNQVLTSNGADALPTWQAAASGAALLHLVTVTANDSASLVLNSTYVTSGRTQYMIVFNAVTSSAADAQLQMTVSNNNGSSYDTTSYTAASLSNNWNASTFSNSNSTACVPIGGQFTDSGTAYSGFLQCTLSAANVAVNGQLFAIAPTPVNISTWGNKSLTNINNLRFAFSTGNIASGSISLYGF